MRPCGKPEESQKENVVSGEDSTNSRLFCRAFSAIVKVNSETGKTVRLNENAAFRIKYLGNPDLADPTASPNYGKYLPNGSDYNDGDGSGKNNYIFKCDENGQIVLPYMLEYGNYQLEEVTVPEGYFVGEYNEKGEGSNAEMPKDFEDAVVIYDSKGNKPHAASGRQGLCDLLSDG